MGPTVAHRVTEAIDIGDWDELHPTALAIVAAAADVIADRGEPFVRLDEVADQLGITTPAMYRYFPGREAVLDAAQAYRLQRSWSAGVVALRELVDAATSLDGFRQTVRHLTVSQFTPDQVPTLLVRAEVYGTAGSRPVLMERIQRIAEAWRVAFVSALEEAERRGLVRPRLPVADVADFVRAIYFGQLQWAIDAADRDTSAITNEIVEIVDSLLFGG